MLRLLLLIGIIGLVWLLVRQLRSAANPPTQGKQTYQRMVACQRCGVHVPASEAISRGEQHFCCAQHADDGR